MHKKAVQAYNGLQLEHPKFGSLLKQSRDVRHTLILFPGLEEYLRLVRSFSNSNSGKNNKRVRPPPPLIPIKTFQGDVTSLKVILVGILEFINFYREGILHRISKALSLRTALKVNFHLNILLRKESADGEVLHSEFGLGTESSEIYGTTDLNKWLDKEIQKLQIRFEEAELQGSNWTLEKIIDLEVRLNRFVPLDASSYIPLPKPIANRKAIINVQNEDNRCFFNSVACKFLPDKKKNKHEDSIYTRELFEKLRVEGKLNFNGLNPDGPTSLKEIDHFERVNNCSVNVYGLTTSKKYPSVYPLRIAKVFKEEKHFDLLYLTNNDNSKQHYCYIKNISRLVHAQKSNHHGGKLHICHSCLQHFYT